MFVVLAKYAIALGGLYDVSCSKYSKLLNKHTLGRFRCKALDVGWTEE